MIKYSLFNLSFNIEIERIIEIRDMNSLFSHERIRHRKKQRRPLRSTNASQLTSNLRLYTVVHCSRTRRSYRLNVKFFVFECMASYTFTVYPRPIRRLFLDVFRCLRPFTLVALVPGSVVTSQVNTSDKESDRILQDSTIRQNPIGIQGTKLLTFPQCWNRIGSYSKSR